MPASRSRAGSKPPAPGGQPPQPAHRLEAAVEEWPCLDQKVLVRARSHRVCMTCHWFRHHAGVNCIPVLTCQLHQGLIAHGEHLTCRCRGWTDDLAHQRGWAPEEA
jgi:hypothetical protein